MESASPEELLRRIAEAEAIITACRRRELAMYESDLEAGWPAEARELQGAYERKYGVSLNPTGEWWET